VKLRSSLCHLQLLGDLFVAQPLGHQPQHLLFPFCQPTRPLSPRPGGHPSAALTVNSVEGASTLVGKPRRLISTATCGPLIPGNWQSSTATSGTSALISARASLSSLSPLTVSLS